MIARTHKGVGRRQRSCLGAKDAEGRFADAFPGVGGNGTGEVQASRSMRTHARPALAVRWFRPDALVPLRLRRGNLRQ